MNAYGKHLLNRFNLAANVLVCWLFDRRVAIDESLHCLTNSLANTNRSAAVAV